MASIRKEILIDAPPQHVWDAIRDFGAVHERLVPGFVVDARLDGDERIVTFFSGAVQREPLVDLDDQARRLVYATVDSPIGAPITTRPYRSSPTARLRAGSSGLSTSCPAGSAALSMVWGAKNPVPPANPQFSERGRVCASHRGPRRPTLGAATQLRAASSHRMDLRTRQGTVGAWSVPWMNPKRRDLAGTLLRFNQRRPSGRQNRRAGGAFVRCPEELSFPTASRRSFVLVALRARR
jgi:Polyketide cyclase / dehydrase and lipid transport